MGRTKCGFDDQPGLPGRDALIRHGPTLTVNIGLDIYFRANRNSHPQLPSQTWPALVDTGAGESCIDSNLASSLNLPIVDQQITSGAHGAHPVNVHLAQIHVPSLNFTIHGRFAGVHLTAGGQPHMALIGRTFLQHFTMIYEGKTGNAILNNDT
jgi:predicted aspartyl protease